MSVKLFSPVKKKGQDGFRRHFWFSKEKQKPKITVWVIISTINFMLSPPSPLLFFWLQRKWDNFSNGINLSDWVVNIWFKHCPCNGSMLFCKNGLLILVKNKKINRKIFCVWCLEDPKIEFSIFEINNSKKYTQHIRTARQSES